MTLPRTGHIHLMGICGTAMASLAGLLQDKGYRVTGSDANPYPPMSTQIERLGIPLMAGYRAENLDPRPDFVIVGNVISANNPEAQELVRLGIPFTSLPKALGDVVLQDRESVVIAGTHGKTTTTSLMSWACEQAGHQPGFLIGGIPKNFSQSFRNPRGRYFVIEGDEYDTAYFDKVPKFIHYRPRHVVLTSVEFDHADIYADLEAVKAAFRRLVSLIPADGHLIYLADDALVSEIAKGAPAGRAFGYGLKTGAYRARVLPATGRTRFEVACEGAPLGLFEMDLAGDYNILNATAVVAMGHRLGWDLERVRAALSSFEGVKRRQEILGEPGGVLVIEDFAHHPTAVRETLKAVQERHQGRRVFAVFEPRSATSRRKVFQKDYVEAFRQGHEILIAKAFDQSKIQSEERFSSEELVADLRSAGVSAQVFEGADAIVRDLGARAKAGDVVLVMSNGGFDGIYQKLLATLANRPGVEAR